MSQGIELTGMVLSSVPSGDYDKRVVLLTKRGARLPLLPEAPDGRGAACCSGQPFLLWEIYAV